MKRVLIMSCSVSSTPPIRLCFHLLRIMENKRLLSLGLVFCSIAIILVVARILLPLFERDPLIESLNRIDLGTNQVTIRAKLLKNDELSQEETALIDISESAEIVLALIAPAKATSMSKEKYARVWQLYIESPDQPVIDVSIVCGELTNWFSQITVGISMNVNVLHTQWMGNLTSTLMRRQPYVR